MFTNLIESKLDKSGVRRRSSFFLATVAGYALVLFTAAIVGVLTYEAQVEAQTTDIQLDVWVPPVNREPEGPRPVTPTRQPRTANAPVDRSLTESVRTQPATGTTSDPNLVPEKVGVEGSSVPPATGHYRISNRNADPEPVTPKFTGCVTCTGATPKIAETETPPIPPKPKQTTLRVTSTVILSKVVDLPKPAYPALAKAARIQGPVNVQILVDETGKVVSAHAVKGSPMLTQAALDAAMRARFTPTKLGADPVKVQGVIVYNFVLQ